MRLLVASSNSKKLKELKELLADLGLELISLAEMLHVVEVEEDGSSFRENAEKKALGYAKQTGCLTLADDSGLIVDYQKGILEFILPGFQVLKKMTLKTVKRF